MPIYAYKCEACGNAQDVLQKMSDPLLTVCPACGQATYKKQLTAAGFQLKGSGWYVTDFREGAKPEKSGDDSKADKKPEGDKADKSDATTATPATTDAAAKSTPAAPASEGAPAKAADKAAPAPAPVSGNTAPSTPSIAVK
jgi:putative FmdB family regulatory protein